MKDDNKPLLFINSAQSSEFKDQNQYVYDSRFNKNEPQIVKKTKKQEEPKNKKVEKVEPVKERRIEKEVIEQKEYDTVDEIKMKKLMNKMELLQKRANLGRFVFVSIKVENTDIECYFLKLLDDKIIVKVEEEEREILIHDIQDIIILKV